MGKDRKQGLVQLGTFCVRGVCGISTWNRTSRRQINVSMELLHWLHICSFPQILKPVHTSLLLHTLGSLAQMVSPLPTPYLPSFWPSLRYQLSLSFLGSLPWVPQADIGCPSPGQTASTYTDLH